jgi:hypothetical protein
VGRRSRTLTRYVYLMRVVLPWYDPMRYVIWLSGDQLVKIGIAKDTDSRERTVDGSHRAKVTTIDKYYCHSASKHEGHLHKLFKDKHYPIHGMDGGTEVYRLSMRDRSKARSYLKRNSVSYSLNEPILATLIFTLTLAAILAALKYYS